MSMGITGKIDSVVSRFVPGPKMSELQHVSNLKNEYRLSDNSARKQQIRQEAKGIFEKYDSRVGNKADLDVRAAAFQLLCDAGDKQAINTAKQAASLIDKLEAFDLDSGGANRPLSLSGDPAAAATVATSDQRAVIRDSLKLTGRYKAPWTFGDNSPQALNRLQQQHSVQNGFGGYRFGTQTRDALISELQKFTR